MFYTIYPLLYDGKNRGKENVFEDYEIYGDCFLTGRFAKLITAILPCFENTQEELINEQR